MLFTRCPECDTTFRVTDETLKKANGQVRCGRCASVFNAYAELHDPSSKSFEPENPAPRKTGEPADAAAGANAPSAAAESASAPPPAAEDPAAAGIGASSVADVGAETSAAADEAAAPTEENGETQSEARPISATEIERVLTADVAAPLPTSAYAWPESGAASARQTSRWWTAAAAIALLALAAQTLHHFRADVAGHPTFGPWLNAAYGALGSEIAPNWDVDQYQIIDWVATAEPNARGLGSLKITARIQNRGPLRQPYPAVQLRLKDRWEEAVGSRTFTPAEYLPRDTPRGRLMSPGETARAELEVVDPGPDTYGFELDVCIEVEASLITCGADEVFL
jgi:predicted Zn finger-like uncharacterized protein